MPYKLKYLLFKRHTKPTLPWTQPYHQSQLFLITFDLQRVLSVLNTPTEYSQAELMSAMDDASRQKTMWVP